MAIIVWRATAGSGIYRQTATGKLKVQNTVQLDSAIARAVSQFPYNGFVIHSEGECIRARKGARSRESGRLAERNLSGNSSVRRNEGG